jgi:uncharacterized protein
MKIRHLDRTDRTLNAEHQALGLPPVHARRLNRSPYPVLQWAGWSVKLLLGGALAWAASQWLHRPDAEATARALLSSEAFWWAVAVGLLAQAVDGALGMAYGITSSSFLLATGSSPAVATTSVHIAEVFTTGLSGLAHLKLGNVSQQLFLRLLLPGMAGALLGAALVTQVNGAWIRPFVSAYLLLMGLYVITKAYRPVKPRAGTPRHVAKLGLVGGFVDAAGGGGWGPVVTTTLVGSGHDPRTTIGSVNLAEFFLTFASAALLTALVDGTPWATVAGLVLGGLFAAPMAAALTRYLSTGLLLLAVGTVITVVSSLNLWRTLA